MGISQLPHLNPLSRFLQAMSPGRMGEFFCRTLFGFLSGKASVVLPVGNGNGYGDGIGYDTIGNISHNKRKK